MVLAEVGGSGSEKSQLNIPPKETIAKIPDADRVYYQKLKTTGIVAERYGKDFNLIGHEEEAKKAFLKDLEKKLDPKQFTSQEDKNTKEKFVRDLQTLADAEFHRWYTGNYNEKTGKITLYRYVDDFPEFEKVLKGEEGLVPRGLRGRTEEQLLDELKKDNADIHKIYTDYKNGKDVSEQLFEYAARSAGGFDKDPILYWTTSDKPIGFAIDRRYRIKIEIGPNEAFRSGGFDEKGNWRGFFDAELEWCTIGKVTEDKIVEIVDMKTGKVVYSKEK